MKVSFDYDGTFDRKDVLGYAMRLVNQGHEVWIVTARWIEDAGPLDNLDILEDARYADIPFERIHFTNGKLKSYFFEKENI